MICRTHVKSDIAKVRTVTVGDPGDLAAAPGSQPWAIAVRLQIQSLLKDNASSIKHLRTWLRGMEEYAGYRQLTDENGQPFPSYAAFCNAKPPWGLGYPPEVIDQILKELELVQAKPIEVEDEDLKNYGCPYNYLQKFSQLVQACPDETPINSAKIEEVLDCSLRTAARWRKRWLDMGWIEQSTSSRRGNYQITEQGYKAVKESSDKMLVGTLNEDLSITIPYNSQKAAEKLIKAFNIEQLKELHSLIGESLNQLSNANNHSYPTLE